VDNNLNGWIDTHWRGPDETLKLTKSLHAVDGNTARLDPVKGATAVGKSLGLRSKVRELNPDAKQRFDERYASKRTKSLYSSQYTQNTEKTSSPRFQQFNLAS